MKDYSRFILIKVKLICVLILFLGGCSKPIGYSDVNCIRKVESLKEIYFKGINFEKPTIIFIDVDDVLITPDDLILRHSFGNPFKIIRELRSDIFSNNYDRKILALNIWGSLLNKRKVHLVETYIHLFLKKLIIKNIEVVALTQLNTGPAGIITSLEQWRVDELKSFDIDFTQMNHIAINFDEFSVTGNPKFLKGIIFTDSMEKYECINFFLKKFPHFKNIILIDDNFNNLKKASENISMDKNFIGYHYVAAKNTSEPLDLNVAALQYRKLMHEHVWLSDQAAHELYYER